MSPISSIDAGRTLCELSGWKISNLEAQKILYFAHMFHLAEEGEPLINETFEAWRYGPVAPKLYRRVKRFGSGPIRNVFYWEFGAKISSSEYRVLKNTYKVMSKISPIELVRITHWEKGAWRRKYKPNVPHIPIPNELILAEYNERDAIS